MAQISVQLPTADHERGSVIILAADRLALTDTNGENRFMFDLGVIVVQWVVLVFKVAIVIGSIVDVPVVFFTQVVRIPVGIPV